MVGEAEKARRLRARTVGIALLIVIVVGGFIAWKVARRGVVERPRRSHGGQDPATDGEAGVAAMELCSPGPHGGGAVLHTGRVRVRQIVVPRSLRALSLSELLTREWVVVFGLAAFFCVFAFVVYWYLGPQSTAYINHVYQADAFLHGRLDLANGSDLTFLELAIKNGKFYESHPPMPSIVLLPGVVLFGLSLNQTLVSVVIGALCAPLVFLIVRSLNEKVTAQIWLTVLFLFGTIFWYTASNGGVWFYSHTVTTFFLLAAVYATLTNRNPLIAGLLLGAAYWSRQTTILSFPFFFIMYSVRWLSESSDKPLWRRIDLKPLLQLGSGVGLFVLLSLGYNYLRFGSPFDNGLNYSDQAQNLTSLYNYGPFDIRYIPRHIPAIFEFMPIFQSQAPYVIPDLIGMSVWATTPAFFYALFPNIRSRRNALLGVALLSVTVFILLSRSVSSIWGSDWATHVFPHRIHLLPFYAMIALAIAAGIKSRDKLVIACWSAIVPVALVLFSFAATGWTQFGYRYALDFYPFLFVLTIKGIGKDIRWYHKLLIVASIVINLWAVLWIYQFDPRGFLGLHWTTI